MSVRAAARSGRRGRALGVLAVLTLVIVTVSVALWRSVDAAADATIRRAECAQALAHAQSEAAPLPAPCGGLPDAELDSAKALASCLLARQRSVGGGLDLDKACRVMIQASDSRR